MAHQNRDYATFVRFSLNKSWRDAPHDNIHPWFCNFDQVRAENSARLVQNFTIQGICFGEDFQLPDGSPTKVMACGESSLTWKGDNLQILTLASAHDQSIRECQKKRVLVRLFTPWLQTRDDDVVLPWRILTEIKPNVFKEEHARSFRISGTSFGLRHDFPHPTGPKMHIACFGSVTWQGDSALIEA